MESLTIRYHKLLETTPTDFHRFLYEKIDWDQPLIGIKGQRGVGKTTLMLQHIKRTESNSEESFYASLDSLWFTNHNLIDFAEKMVEKGVKHLYLDEVHKLPNWERQLKNIYDLYPELKVVFTGSSLLEIDHSIADLSRRVSMHNLPGLSFREFLIFERKGHWDSLELNDILYSHSTIVHSILAEVPNILHLFAKYLKTGYYPFFRNMKRDDYYNRLEQMVNTVIESDIPSVEKMIEYESLIKAKRLVSIIAGSVPFVPNMTTLAGLMSTNRSQLTKLLDLLERAGIIRQIFTIDKSPKSLVKPQKILLNNSALMNALANPKTGSERECTFASLLSAAHNLNSAKQGDFLVDGRYIFEVGGKGKGFSQIRNLPDSYVAADEIEFGMDNKIPLWLFGFLY